MGCALIDKSINIFQQLEKFLMIYGMRSSNYFQKKKDKTIGRPVIPFRKVLDGIQRLVMTVDALLHICHAMKCNIWYYKTES
jgi:hypothetical protein